MSNRTEPDIDLAARLFAQLREDSLDPPGVTRDAYGAGEEQAHDLMKATARELGLAASNDHAGNLYITLPGRDPEAKPLVIGSHLDTVPHGGNYDGAAGVVAGLAVVAGLRRAQSVPERDIIVMAVRGEESTWFPTSYTGSRAALGTLPADAPDTLFRLDTGRSLAAHMSALGYDPQGIRDGKRHLTPETVGGYLEAHIEQGPVLIERDVPVAVITAITGALRYREGRVWGTYAHVGGATRRHRHDAMSAMAAFIEAMNRSWAEMEEAGHYLLVTFGRVGTDPAMHAWSKVSGEVHWTLDIRSDSDATLAEMKQRMDAHIADAEQRFGVRFESGQDSGPRRADMDAAMQAGLTAAARARGVPVIAMPSGAGHDAAAFAQAGIPAAMLFIRNQHGSHNPDEAMEIDDFAEACRVMTGFVLGEGA
jgi:N-carbamoyl-L-amino-acid hydrolase